MEIEINRDELVKSMNLLQGIVERRNTMPILSHVLLHAENSTLSLSATDLDVGMTISCMSKTVKKGDAAVQGRKLYEIVKELSEGASVRMKMEENFWMEIHSQKSRFKLSGLDPKDFPTLPKFEEMKYESMDGQKLHEMIEKTVYAVSQDESRKNLSGVYIETVDHSLRMVATDGHRLVYIDRKGTISGLGKKGPLLSKRGLLEIKKVIEGGEKEIKLALTENTLLVKGEKVSLFTRLIDGEFPDYHMVIPKEGKKKVTAKREDLLTSLRRVAVIMGGRSPAVKVTLTKGLIQFSSVNPEIGEARDEVPAEYQGEDIEIGMNARYLIEPLSVLTEDEVLIELTDDASPVLLRKKDSRDEIVVIMPMRVT